MDERFFRIALSLADGVGPVTYRKILARLAQEGKAVEELFSVNAEFLATEMLLRSNVIKGILNVRESFDDIRATMTTLEEREILAVLENEQDYPERLRLSLRDSAPAVLYCWGNVNLLHEASVGIVGTRQPDEDGLTQARRAARYAVDAQRVVVSGCARGVDSAAHSEALDVGGSTIGVLAQGLLTTRFSELVEAVFDPASCLIVSEFPPRRGWSAGAALGRNRTICALSDALLVVQASGRGGSLECGRAALSLRKPLFAIKHYDALTAGWNGNEKLIGEGACPLTLDSDSGEVDFSPFLSSQRYASRILPHQQRLFPERDE